MDGGKPVTDHLLCVGMGYSARALSKRLGPKGWTITGTATGPAGMDRIAAAGWNGVPFDGSAPSMAVAQALRTATHLVVSASPGEAGDPLLRNHADDIARAPHLTWIGYLSTIGVYGDHQGRWIDETAPSAPGSARSRQRVVAESAWLDFARAASRRVQIFRLAGIYGPGRSAIGNLRDGTARRIIKPGQVFNRIHVEDIASTLEAAIDRPDAQHIIYNVTDDEPAPPQDVVAYAAQLLNMPVPPDIAFENAPLSPMGLSFYAENKRVSNARMKTDLGVALQFPTYREGMAGIVKAGS
jgi:nucleoside-diphosphate-sugar epimerase